MTLIVYPGSQTITEAASCKVFKPDMDSAVFKAYQQALNSAKFETQHLSCFPSVQPGTVVVLAGTSTAGKSSIVNALKKMDADILEEDLDLRTADTQKIPGPNAQQDMMDDVIKSSLHGKTVVVHVDQAYKFLDHALKRKVDLPVKTVLAFCPFHELSRRLIDRNLKAEALGGDLQNLRDPLMPIANFGNLYTQVKEGGQGLETIGRDQAINIFNDHFDKMIAYAKKLGNSLPPDDEIAKEKVTDLQEFLLNLGFKKGVDSVDIEPRNRAHYDFIFDTHKYGDATGSETIAHILYDSLKKDA